MNYSTVKLPSMETKLIWILALQWTYSFSCPDEKLKHYLNMCIFSHINPLISIMDTG